MPELKLSDNVKIILNGAKGQIRATWDEIGCTLQYKVQYVDGSNSINYAWFRADELEKLGE